MPSVAGSLSRHRAPYRDREKGLSLNSTGLEVYGKGTDFEQRQNKTGGTMDMDGGMRGGRSQKRLRPRKGIEGAQKKLGRPYG